MKPYRTTECQHEWQLIAGKYQRFRCLKCALLGYRALSMFGGMGRQSRRQPKLYRCKQCGSPASVARFTGTTEVFECASCSEARVAS